MFTCDKCSANIGTSEVSLEQHCINAHSYEENITFAPLLGNVLLLPGPDHIEYMAKLLLRFCWEPFLSHFVCNGSGQIKLKCCTQWGRSPSVKADFKFSLGSTFQRNISSIC